MHIQESGEMYLEAIYVLSQRSGCTRSIDVAEYLNYTKPSVSRAVSLLKSGGYVRMEKDGTLSLTPTGLEIAQKIYARHTLISQVLEKLGVSPETAAADACRIEHAISDESFAAIRAFAEKI